MAGGKKISVFGIVMAPLGCLLSVIILILLLAAALLLLLFVGPCAVIVG